MSIAASTYGATAQNREPISKILHIQYQTRHGNATDITGNKRGTHSTAATYIHLVGATMRSWPVKPLSIG
jgi:hypothetical protein